MSSRTSFHRNDSKILDLRKRRSLDRESSRSPRARPQGRDRSTTRSLLLPRMRGLIPPDLHEGGTTHTVTPHVEIYAWSWIFKYLLHAKEPASAFGVVPQITRCRRSITLPPTGNIATSRHLTGGHQPKAEWALRCVKCKRTPRLQAGRWMRPLTLIRW
jgi:hypothetical protein